MPIEAISGVTGPAVLQAASVRPPDLQSLAESFDRQMVHEPDPWMYTEQHLSQQDSPVATYVSRQEDVLRSTFEDVRAFGAQAPQMDMREMMIRHMEISARMSMVQVQFNAGVYVAQSGKSGLQTLMKNQ